MKEPLKFEPGAKFFRDEDGFPVVVEGGKPFACGPLGKAPLPALPDAHAGAREVDEAEFRALVKSGV